MSSTKQRSDAAHGTLRRTPMQELCDLLALALLRAGRVLNAARLAALEGAEVPDGVAIARHSSVNAEPTEVPRSEAR